MIARKLHWCIQHRSPTGRKWWIVGYRRTRAEARQDRQRYRKDNPDDHWRVVSREERG